MGEIINLNSDPTGMVHNALMQNAGNTAAITVGGMQQQTANKALDVQKQLANRQMDVGQMESEKDRSFQRQMSERGAQLQKESAGMMAKHQLMLNGSFEDKQNAAKFFATESERINKETRAWHGDQETKITGLVTQRMLEDRESWQNHALKMAGAAEQKKQMDKTVVVKTENLVRNLEGAGPNDWVNRSGPVGVAWRDHVATGKPLEECLKGLSPQEVTAGVAALREAAAAIGPRKMGDGRSVNDVAMGAVNDDRSALSAGMGDLGRSVGVTGPSDNQIALRDRESARKQKAMGDEMLRAADNVEHSGTMSGNYHHPDSPALTMTARVNEEMMKNGPAAAMALFQQIQRESSSGQGYRDDTTVPQQSGAYDPNWRAKRGISMPADPTAAGDFGSQGSDQNGSGGNMDWLNTMSNQ